MSAEQITTAAELDALPVGSRVLDRFGDVGQHCEQGVWSCPETVDLTSRYLAGHYGPFRVLYRPDRPDRPVPQVDEDAEGAMREAMTDALSIAVDEGAPVALLASLRDLGWVLAPARGDAAPQVDREALLDALATPEVHHPDSCDCQGRERCERIELQADRVLDLLAARGSVAPSAPLRTEWGVLLDDLGSTDVHASRDQAEAARHLADGDLPLVRVETWVVRDERPSSPEMSCSCSQPMEYGRHGHACDLYGEGPQGGDRS